MHNNMADKGWIDPANKTIGPNRVATRNIDLAQHVHATSNLDVANYRCYCGYNKILPTSQKRGRRALLIFIRYTPNASVAT